MPARLIRSWTCSKSASSFPIQKCTEIRISTRHQDIKVVITALSQATNSSYQETASGFRIPGFVLLSTVYNPQCTAQSMSYLPLHPSFGTLVLSAIALHVLQQLLPYGRLPACQYIYAFFIPVLHIMLNDRITQVLLPLKYFLPRKAGHHEVEHALQPLHRKRCRSLQQTYDRCRDSQRTRTYDDGSQFRMEQLGSLLSIIRSKIPRLLFLSVIAASFQISVSGEAIRAWKESQPCKLSFARTSLLLQCKTHSCNNISVSYMLPDIPTKT